MNILCSLRPSTDTNQVGTSHAVTVTVTQNGAPQAGVAVSFTVSGANTASGTGTTDTNGQATFSYTGSNTGLDTITASGSLSGVPFSCTASKTWVDNQCSLSPATATNQIGTTHTVTVTVTQNGAPQAGVTVNFNVTAGPNAGVNGMGTTDNNGQAMFTYMSNGTPGTDTIQASGSLSSVPFSCTASKTWINAACSLAPLTATNFVNTAHTVTVTVTQNGAPQSGVTVNFNVTSGPNAGATGLGTTNASGQATFTYTGSGGTGTDTITASGSLSGVPFSCTATKTWIAVPPIIINEVDSDTPGTDTLEFVELYDGGAGNTSLTGLVVVFYNGANDQSYAAFDLDGFTTNANGYFVLGNAGVAGVDLVFADNFLQNGADAVALYLGNATDFPNNTPVTTTNLVDALVYDTSDPDDPGLLVLLNAGEPQVDENGAGSGATQSM
ncbi:MAG: Ig-like domain-containing protein, partial [Blastocatellia bacterium]|nr:Ig-like domain-containing protein [Blastocatellia bacterium]